MKLISYWIDSGNSPKEIQTDDGMVLSHAQHQVIQTTQAIELFN